MSYRRMFDVAFFPARNIIWGFVVGLISPILAASAEMTHRGFVAADGTAIDVREFGAKCDGASDDSDAWQSAIDHIASIRVSERGPPLASKLVGCQAGNSLIEKTLNFTGFTGVGNPPALAFTVDMSGTCLVGRTKGRPVIDALGARYIHWEHLCIFGDSIDTPSIGIQIGRVSNRSADDFLFDGPVIYGRFTFAAFYNLASETNTFISAFFSNLQEGGTSYALVLDGYNHFGVRSEFVSQSLAVDSPQSFNENVFIGGRFLVNKSGIPIWIGNACRHRFISSYAATAGRYGAVLYNDAAGAITQLLMDVHFETPSMTDVFLVSGKNPTPTLYGFTYTDNYPQASRSIFKLDVGERSATIVDASIRIVSFFAGHKVKVFEAPDSWSVSGSVQVPDKENWGAPASFSGILCLSQLCTSLLSKNVRNIIDDGLVPVTGSDDIMCIRGATVGPTVIKLEKGPAIGRTLIISDCSGDANKNKIVVVPDGSYVDGAPTFVIENAWGSWEGYFNGRIWKTISSR